MQVVARYLRTVGLTQPSVGIGRKLIYITIWVNYSLITGDGKGCLHCSIQNLFPIPFLVYKLPPHAGRQNMQVIARHCKNMHTLHTFSVRKFQKHLYRKRSKISHNEG